MSISQPVSQLALLIPCFLALVWASIVWQVVPEPYLDEVFHIRQAQAYAQGRWHVWDPKITTPPGLYLVSWLQTQLGRAVHLRILEGRDYRSVNALASFLMIWMLRRPIRIIAGCDADEDQAAAAIDKGGRRWSSAEFSHTIINIILFPPLFFFYGLYYTDVLSALSVLYAYRCYLLGQRGGVILAGLISLLFRQTNIFWAAVFLGGLELCRTLPKGRAGKEVPSRPMFWDMVHGSWHHSCAYDPPISDACFEDYIKSALSISIASISQLPKSLTSLAPYILLLCIFSAFVIWNGGVVLGDKENHIASLHLAQTLYLWPYFTFFSFPLLYPYLLNAILPQPSLPPVMRIGSTRSRLPHPIVAIPILVAMTAIVHYNTIIHPFTLADNRHYTFYVFRLLLRHSMIKYLVVPVYFISAWTVLIALGGQPNAQEESTFQSTDPRSVTKGETAGGERTSFLLIWLLATTLSLCTAPLVEPRYCIVPWLIWRMHIPPAPRHSPPTADTGKANQQHHPQDTNIMQQCLRSIRTVFRAQDDHRLWMETVWFLVVSAVTGYIFLYWGFEWKQEPGRVMRFMW